MKTITLLLIAVAFVFSANVAVNKIERAECLEWQEQAKTARFFYLLEWQGAQCEAVGIDTGAIITKECKPSESGKDCQIRLGDEWEVIQYPDGYIRGERI